MTEPSSPPPAPAPLPPSVAAEARLARAYFDYAFDGIIESDVELCIVRGNPAAASILGVARTRLHGRRLDEFIDGGRDNLAEMAKHRALLVEQGISRVELALRPHDAEDTCPIVELSSVDIGDGRILHVFDDVTAQRQAEQAGEEARRAAEQANRAKTAFLANMSHEIRTPLNGVIGLAELLRLTPLQSDQADLVRNILHSSRTLLDLLNDLLDLAKIEAGRLEFEQQPFDLHAVLAEMDVFAQPLAREKQLDWRLQPDPEMPSWVVGDRLRLTQILRNLLANALKFTSRGGVELHATVDVTATPPLLRFRVRDSGIGMSAEQVARLFQPFSQADASTTRRFGGTGLGLSISQMLAAGMGGRIDVQSQPGAGSEFVLQIAAPVFAGAVPATPADASAAIVKDSYRGARVLVADDNRINQQVISGLLRHAGIEVSIAGDGREAIAMVATATRPYHLIVMDIQMPVLDGLEATRHLRDAGCATPIIAFTAGITEVERSACEAAGTNDVLAKPIDLDELDAVLTRWLPTRASTTPSTEPTAAEVHADVLMQFPGIDAAEALPRFLGDHGRLAAARDAFLDQHGDSALRLVALARNAEWAELRRLAHGLRGAAANLGARGLQELARRLEERPELGAAEPELLPALGHELQLIASVRR